MWAGVRGFEAFVEEVLIKACIKPDSTPSREARLVEDLGLDSLQLFSCLVTAESLVDRPRLPEDPPMPATLGELYAYYRELADSISWHE